MDIIVVLVVVLIVALIWRGPRTLPQIGAMLGRGVKAVRDQVNASKGDQGGGSAA